MTGKYKELKGRYAAYIGRITKQIKTIEDGLENCDVESAKLQRQLSDVAAMTAEEYKITQKKLNAVFSEMEYYEQLKKTLESSSHVTHEEYLSFKKELADEQKRVAAEAEAEIYKLLLPVVDLAEKYTTELNELSALKYSFTGSFGKKFKDSTIGMSFANCLPMLLRNINVTLQSAFNQVAKQNGEPQTDCINYQELTAERKDLSLLGKTNGFGGLPEIRITERDYI